MTNREKLQVFINRLNLILLSKTADEIQWNTPGAYFLESYKPGYRRIYQLTRNSNDCGGQTTLISGELKEVRIHVLALLDGIELGKAA